MSNPRLCSVSPRIRAVSFRSILRKSRLTSFPIKESSTSMTCEYVRFSQKRMAVSSVPEATAAPFIAPTEVPDTALKRIPSSLRAFHAPIS